MRDGKWHYTIKGFKPTNQGGGLDFETVHIGTASRDVEIAAAQARMQRGGELSHIDVIAHVEPYDTVRIYGDTEWPTKQKSQR